jgi:non-heme chloroperoxidase
MNELLTMHGLSVRVTHARASSRPPLLLVHGMFGGAWYWERYQQFFAARGYTSYAIDLRGHHGSRPVDDIGHVRFRDYVDDALSVAATLGRPIVLGHSMGGLIAQRLAEENAVIAAVMMCSAPPRWIPPISVPLASRIWRYLPKLLLSKPLLPRNEDADYLMFNRTPPIERQEYYPLLVPESGRAGLELSLGAIAIDAKRVQCPMLSVAAEDDHFLVPRVGRALAKKYHCRLMTFPGHAHSIMTEPGWETPAAQIAEWIEDSLGLDASAA